jgi:hypothetical protein
MSGLLQAAVISRVTTEAQMQQRVFDSAAALLAYTCQYMFRTACEAQVVPARVCRI